jgi:hypothetical protein
MKAQPSTATTPPNPVVPQALDAWIVTDFMGHIHDISPAAAGLISMSAAGAYGRQMQLFFVADRQNVIRDMRAAREGTPIETVRTLKPRERRSIPVRIELALAEEYRDHLLWRFHRDA